LLVEYVLQCLLYFTDDSKEIMTRFLLGVQPLGQLNLGLSDGPQFPRCRRISCHFANSGVCGAGQITFGGNPVTNLLGHDLDYRNAGIVGGSFVNTILEVSEICGN